MVSTGSSYTLAREVMVKRLLQVGANIHDLIPRSLVVAKGMTWNT